MTLEIGAAIVRCTLVMHYQSWQNESLKIYPAHHQAASNANTQTELQWNSILLKVTPLCWSLKRIAFADSTLCVHILATS